MLTSRNPPNLESSNLYRPERRPEHLRRILKLETRVAALEKQLAEKNNV